MKTDLSMAFQHLDDPLVNALYAHRALFESMAEVWQRAGAHAFGVWNDALLACWPDDAWNELRTLQHSGDVLWASIKIEDRIVGKIAAIGLSGQQQRAHLALEAELLSQVVAGKIKFEHAATELIAQAQLKTEVDMAAKIQLHLLPQAFPSVSGLQTFARSNPAAQVGGDFYDFVAHRNGSCMFSVGDVSGKGMAAALFMAMTRILLHAASRSIPNVTPKIAIGRVNEDLYDDFSEAGMFATVFVASYQAAEKQLLYANAGHSPVIYLAAGGHAAMLEADAPAIGVLPILSCNSHSLPFCSGDVLVVGTDGLSECMNAEGEMFGYPRLLALVEELAHLSAQQIGDAVFARIDDFTQGYNQFDDQTLVVMKGIS